MGREGHSVFVTVARLMSYSQLCHRGPTGFGYNLSRGELNSSLLVRKRLRTPNSRKSRPPRGTSTKNHEPPVGGDRFAIALAPTPFCAFCLCAMALPRPTQASPSCQTATPIRQLSPRLS